MKLEKELELVRKYPLIFRDYRGQPMQTCMAWRMSCSDGWYDLIDNLCNKIQTYIDENNVHQVVATQVKEKFGGLRFYYMGGDSYTDELVNDAENESYITCEHCGTKENIGHTTRWIITLCRDCYEKTDKRHEFKPIIKKEDDNNQFEEGFEE